MKSGILMAAVLSLLSVPAFADQLCGTLDSYTTGPKCAPGAPCPTFMALKFEIEGTTLSADNTAILTSLEQDKGEKVCAEGKASDSSPPTFDVEQIKDFSEVPSAPPSALRADNAPLSAPSYWLSGDTGLTITGSSAHLQFTCGSIQIDNWHADGKPMHGQDFTGLVVSRPVGTPIRVTATAQVEGNTTKLYVHVGTGASSLTVFSRTDAEHAPGLTCL